MEIVFTKVEARVPVDILHINGDLDGSSYKDVIAAAQKLYDEGSRQLLLDLTHMQFMSSAGLAALHIITKVFRGEKAPDPEDGWSTFHDIGHSPSTRSQHNVKLLNPTEKILDVLDMVGFKPLYEIFTDLDEAVQSF